MGLPTSNGDGRTDVLDLHLTLNRMREPVHEQGAPPEAFSLAAPGFFTPDFLVGAL